MPRYAVTIPLELVIEVDAETEDVAYGWALNAFAENVPVDPLAEIKVPDQKLGDNKITGIVIKTATEYWDGHPEVRLVQ